ncbi:MAG: GGDEF domain-containing protein [Candidatus Omnitrophota bacterium]
MLILYAKNKKILFLIAVIIVIILAFFDYVTGYETSFSIFYLIPILMVAWFKRIRDAVIISILSSGAWLAADIASGHYYSVILVPLWNTLMWGMVFIIIVAMSAKVKKELEREKKLSRLDMLTGLNNTMSFMEQAKVERNRASRFKRPFTIAYIDIDNFKRLNDTLGHGKGDILLQDLGKIIRENIRAYDIAARLGGDEFVILFPETDEKQAREAVNKIKYSAEKILLKHMDCLTLSIGVVTAANPTLSIDKIIEIADNLMYSVKNTSKNGIECKTLD